MANQDVVKYGGTFYLKHQKTGQYLIAVDRQRYNFPKLDKTGKVKLELRGVDVKRGDSVASGNSIKIRTTESGTAINDILGAFTDSHDCYYWRDGYDNDKQSWQIVKVSGDVGPIRYGEPVYLTNRSYTTQKLCADTRYPGYITTAENVQDSWILESTVATITRTEPRVFKWSVASGDPTETSVILWTRVDAEVYQKNPSSPLKYEIATDRDFTKIEIRGEVSGSTFGESTDYTVHIDVDKLPNQINSAKNKLEPNKEYFYRFIYDGETSPLGRCRTLPPANYEYKNGESLKFAVLTCNDYSSGYFNALYTLAAEEKLDFIIHLGDFTYEYFKYSEGYGDILRTDLFDCQDETTQGTGVATSLKNFRNIHRTYYEDPALQWAMANYTWIIMLDDHEFADNCYWDYDKQTLSINDEGAANPIYKDKTSDWMRQLYDGAIQAWTEYIPARVTQDVSYKVGNEERKRYKLYRSFRFGKLVDFYLTDSRSFRDKPDLEKNAEIVEAAAKEKVDKPQTLASECIANALADARKKASKDQSNPDNWRWSMLGSDQKKWLIDGLYPKTIPPNTTDTIWKVWGNQTLLALSPLCQATTYDDWHGFKAERYEILQTIKERESARPGSGNSKSHFVVFTGDMHTSMIAYLKPDYLAGGVKRLGGVADMLPAWFQTAKDELPTGDYSRYVGVEFMTPSLTSPGISEGIYAMLRVGVEKAGGKFEDWVIGKGTFKAVSETLSPVTETASAAASYILGTVSSVLGTAISAVTPDAVESIVKEASFHKLVTGNVIKTMSPHIEHFDSGINGYAIAEFTPDELKWRVYDVDTTDYDKLDNGQGKNVRNVSTNRVKRNLVQSATYQPNGINLIEHPLT